MKLQINDIKGVKDFTQLCQTIPYATFATRDRMCADCKSLMGMFALDTSIPFEFEIVDAPLITYESFKGWEC